MRMGMMTLQRWLRKRPRLLQNIFMGKNWLAKTSEWHPNLVFQHQGSHHMDSKLKKIILKMLPRPHLQSLLLGGQAGIRMSSSSRMVVWFGVMRQMEAEEERSLEILPSYMNWIVIRKGKSSWMTSSFLCRRGILDLYMLYKLVTEKGGLVEIINKKIWREITKGLNLPTSITSAAFTLRTQYMKYLYAYECEKKALSSPAELQAAIDGNRREGRRPSYSSSLFGYSPSVTPAATRAPALLSTPKVRFPILGLGSNSGTSASNPRISPATALRKGDGVPVTTVPVPNRLAVPVTLAGQQAGTRMATLEQLREQLESGEPPEKKASKLSEEEQRLVQQAFQRNFFSMARQLPVKIRVNGREDRSEASATALNLTTGGIGSINMSVDIDGTTYAGVLFAQKPVVHLIAGSTPQSTSSSSSGNSHCSPSPTSSRGTPSAEPSTSWSL
uniref:AT-rich interactive domain-containing protein 3 n=1 Tax=Molossus molossus TaxID=27622 RepID=A0A7J8JSD5_MOLMO|nr:AT-rich interaction domain 3B [Molossus molossus]